MQDAMLANEAPDGAAGLGNGAPIAFSPGDFDRVKKLLRDETGINLAASKESLVYSRLARRLRALGMSNFNEYCKFVSSASGASELNQMCETLTTNVTKYFREGHHFEHMKTKSLPKLIEAARQGARIRLWSSACSSGEEPYSIALTLLSMMPDAASHDIKILATDLSQEVVEKGKRGCYSKDDLSSVPAGLASKWFKEQPGAPMKEQFQAVDGLRKLITFRQLNLIGKWPMGGPFQIIFCRNVAIYFDEATQATLWQRLAAMTAPDGHMYIGHSERIRQPEDLGLSIDGVTIYHKNGGSR